MAKKVPCTNEKQSRKAFINSMRKTFMPVSRRNIDRIPKESLDPKDALRIEDRNKLFDGPIDVDFGWWQLENGTAMTANPTFFPGVTGEMFDWWFALASD